MILLSGDNDLLEEPLIEDPFMLFCLNTHPLSARETLTWKDLRGADLVTFGGASGNRVFLDHQLASRGIDMRGRFEVEQLSAAIGLVAVGAGVAILPASILLARTHPEVRQIPLVNPVIKRPVGLVRRRGVTLSPAAQALYDLLAQELKSSAPDRGTAKALSKRGRG